MTSQHNNLNHLLTMLGALYLETHINVPTVEQPIAPLNLLINHFSLMSVELSNLTIASASSYLTRRSGALLQSDVLTADALAGFLYVTRHHGCIFVEHTDLLVRRRFSAAHELGHFVLHFRPILERLPEDSGALVDAFLASAGEGEPNTLPTGKLALPSDVLNDYTEADLEREANQFAAELLMPRQVVFDLLTRYERQFAGADLVRWLAGTFLVSQAAMRWRLYVLGVEADSLAQRN